MRGAAIRFTHFTPRFPVTPRKMAPHPKTFVTFVTLSTALPSTVPRYPRLAFAANPG